jgi:hypothetical protein
MGIAGPDQHVAAGFSVWSQTMMLEYLRCCPTPDGAPVRALLRTGTVTGATALGPALTACSSWTPWSWLSTPSGWRPRWRWATASGPAARPSRRVREVAFLPVQAPTVVQLRAQAG